NRKNVQPIGTRKELIWLEDWRYGWQRFGEHNDNTFLDPFIEGAWMTKHNNKYYLQYAAPGTEFSGYADGVAVSNSPLGFFVPQSDPLSIKAGGFARGAGHGATFQDNFKNYWHTSTIQISVKNTFERRLGLWMAGFDKDDIMFCNTSFGDYPHYIPTNFQNNVYGSNFTGWMLLNYNKPVAVSSTYKSFNANFAVDENLKTYWSAETANQGEWIMSDLGEISTIHAIQINYADQDVEKNKLGKFTNQAHQYKLYASNNKKDWQLIMDKSTNKTDIPHEYIAFDNPIKYRYIKLENIQMPTGKFAISGLRIFGKGNGSKPDSVNEFIVLRTEKDKRSAYIKWSPVDNAFGYNIYYGTAPDKLYNSIMLYTTNEYWFKGMDLKKKYYFTIEAINENGISKKYKILEVE
ncbi:MAG: discoidin domain-containing protein, partial [Sediminibacterium sp.]|nr:discoidin domain-containing protein [Sediminibacterium sp.]